MITILKVAWQGIRGFPVRTILSVVSIALGTVTIVTVFAASTSLRTAIQHDAILSGGPVETVEVSGDPSAGAVALLTSLREDAMRRGTAKRTSFVTSLTGVTVERDGVPISLQVEFCDLSFRSIRPLVVVSGSWPVTASSFVPEVAVNMAAAKAGVIVGQLLQVRSTGTDPLTVRVSGVVDDAGKDPQSYGMSASAQDWLDARRTSVTQTLILSGPNVTQPGVQGRASELASLEANQSSLVVSRLDTVEDLNRTLSESESALFAVGSLGVIAALLAVGNINLANIRQRSQELAVRRAMGAHRITLGSIALLESFLIGLVGGALSVPLSAYLYGSIGDSLRAQIGEQLPPYPAGFALLGVAAGCSAAVISGLVPAVYAAARGVSSFSRE